MPNAGGVRDAVSVKLMHIGGPIYINSVNATPNHTVATGLREKALAPVPSLLVLLKKTGHIDRLSVQVFSTAVMTGWCWTLMMMYK